MDKPPIYENSTISTSPTKQSYNEQVFEFNEEMLEPHNFFNVEQANVTFYTDGSNDPNCVSAQSLRIPVVSTAADSTTRGNGFAYAIENAVTDPQASGVDSNINRQAISSPINSPAMSMPLITNNDITTPPQPSMEESILPSIPITNEPSPIEDVQPLVIDTQATNEETLACDKSRSPTSSMTSDVLSSIIESTVCSSEQHNTLPLAGNEKQPDMETLDIPSANCVPSSSNELSAGSSNSSQNVIFGSGDANIAPLETEDINFTVESESTVVGECSIPPVVSETTVTESTEDKNACAGDNHSLWINNSKAATAQENCIPAATTASSIVQERSNLHQMAVNSEQVVQYQEANSHTVEAIHSELTYLLQSGAEVDPGQLMHF